MIEKVKYTLDRIENGKYVFLEYPNEVKQLLIQATEIIAEVSEGDIVLISNSETGYKIEVEKEETEITFQKVNNLLDKLKNKK